MVWKVIWFLYHSNCYCWHVLLTFTLPLSSLCPCMKARETPLHIAARVKEGEKVAEMLLKSGADVNAEQEVRALPSLWPEMSGFMRSEGLSESESKAV